MSCRRTGVVPAEQLARTGRLGPTCSVQYLRYYASDRPTDDHGTRPSVLVVFDDELAASHFLRVARQEIEWE